MAGTYRIEWDLPKIAFISETLPRVAHQVGLAAAALAAADAINAKSGTGRLEADVRTPKEYTTMSGAVGSDLPYARIQHEGGTIVPRNAERLLIHGIAGAEGPIYGRRYPAGFEGGLGGQFATQDVVASAYSVTIPAKRYLDVAAPAYQAAVTNAMSEGFPK
jgi:hypothetical protein